MSFLDATIEKIKKGEQVSQDELVYLAIQFEKLEANAKGCCCEDGSMLKEFDMGNPEMSGFDKKEWPFPTIGATACDKCHGANVMRRLNERQKEQIRILQLQLDACKNQNLK
jgi:hypothetical protein